MTFADFADRINEELGHHLSAEEERGLTYERLNDERTVWQRGDVQVALFSLGSDRVMIVSSVGGKQASTNSVRERIDELGVTAVAAFLGRFFAAGESE